MPPLFYQSYWHVIGENVTQSVISSLNSGKILESINHTFITLIPKVKNPENVSNYHPPSLCNVIYKIISKDCKVIINRLKKILPSTLSESQSAFVPMQLITDDMLVAFESLHHMKCQSRGETGFMSMKLYLSKAYNRVEWSFMGKIMAKMGFHDQWISLIMEYFSIVPYSILVNNEPQGYIRPTRGLCQGDPPSPTFSCFVQGVSCSDLSGYPQRGQLRAIYL